MMKFRPDRHKVDSRFLYYFFKSAEGRNEILRFASQVGTPGIGQPLASLRQFMVPCPSLSDQTAIANVLSALDDKIELNRLTNETLEQMAQAIFKDWFVDFGPIRRKQEGATDPVAIMGGLVQDAARAAELAEIFPDFFGDDDLPEGWVQKGLDEIADFLNGLALQKFPPETTHDSLPVIKISELRNGVTARSDRASRDIPLKYLVRDGDFLFSWSGSLLAKFWTEGEGALNQHLFKVTSNRYPAWFFTHWVHFHLGNFRRIAESKATTMGHIQRGHLNAAMTVCPPIASLKPMTRIMEPLVTRTIHNDLESRTLAETRGYLLPKLMSGEVRVREAEKLAEPA
jgi:type I restriction enzyme S subunit